MSINENTIKGKWLEIKGDIQKSWGELTHDELDKTKGDVKAISGLLQQKYGQAQDSYSQKLSEIFAKFETKKEATLAAIKEDLKK